MVAITIDPLILYSVNLSFLNHPQKSYIFYRRRHYSCIWPYGLAKKSYESSCAGLSKKSYEWSCEKKLWVVLCKKVMSGLVKKSYEWSCEKKLWLYLATSYKAGTSASASSLNHNSHRVTSYCEKIYLHSNKLIR